MAHGEISADVYGLGVGAAIVLLAGALVSFLLPLGAPAPTTQAAMQWLNAEAGAYLFGWLNQLVMMLACTVIFAVAGWSISGTAPLRAVAVWALTLISTAIFLISKFFALWSVPLMAKAIASESAAGPQAEAFLLALAPSEAFGLMGSLDYLGFWLYGLIGLFLFLPLYRRSLSAKIAAIVLLLYGVAFTLVFVAALIDLIGQADVAAFAMSLGLSLLIASAALLVQFRAERKAARGADPV